MKTFAEVAQWIAGAAEQFGDPARPVGQLFFRWRESLDAFDGDDLACGMQDGEFVLYLGPGTNPLPMPVRVGAMQVEAGPDVLGPDELVAYGATRLAAGVWYLTPSLNVEGLIHGFVVLYNVPDPAPFERLIVTP